MPLSRPPQRKMRGITVNKTAPCADCGCQCGLLGLDANNRKVCMDCLNGLACVFGCCLDRPIKGKRGE